MFVKRGGGIVDSGIVILLPDVDDPVRRLPFDHAHFHDFSELSRTGVVERESVGYLSEHVIYY